MVTVPAPHFEEASSGPGPDHSGPRPSRRPGLDHSGPRPSRRPGPGPRCLGHGRNGLGLILVVQALIIVAHVLGEGQALVLGV
jgi:hypothetical protein